MTSAVGACPGDNESAGVNYSHRSPKGNRHMRRLLNQAANAAARTKGGIFEIVYRRSKSWFKSWFPSDKCASLNPPTAKKLETSWTLRCI